MPHAHFTRQRRARRAALLVVALLIPALALWAPGLRETSPQMAAQDKSQDKVSLARATHASASPARAFALFPPAHAQSPQQCAQQLTFNPADGRFLTSDTLFLPDQEGANCYAWQMFVALNWPVHPGWPATPALAGEPDRTAHVSAWGLPAQPGQAMPLPVWASYQDASRIFLPGAVTPPGWGTSESAPPPGCGGANSLLVHRVGAPKILRTASKAAVNSVHRFHLGTGTSTVRSDEIMQATGGWLTDQNGNLVYFERKVNLSEFNYITGKRLYDAARQLQVATNADGTSPEGISLPKGKLLRTAPTSPQPQTDLGAIEIKSAWRILLDPAHYSRYLTSAAYLIDPDTKECVEATVGLVGLHIIHKTTNFPDFIWTTFEHTDNVPDQQSVTPPFGYSFNNPACIGASCTPNQARIDCSGSGGCKPLYPKSQPVQVTRAQPSTSTLNDLNTAVQTQIAALTANQSVFRFYKLVNVLWDQSPSPPANEPGANAPVPLRYGTFASQDSLNVASTILETYIQNRSCDACHSGATIAGSATLAADFSFLFQDADSALQPNLLTRSEAFKP